MRPEIPEYLVQKMEEEPRNIEVDNMYEIGGHNSKGEFIRTAVKEKLDEVENMDDEFLDY